MRGLARVAAAVPLAVTCAVAIPAAASAASPVVASRAGQGSERCDRERLPQGAQPVHLRPACFVRDVTNPWFPLAPGSRWVYRETGGGATQRVVVHVTQERKTILGISAVVVRDTVYDGRAVIEDTRDWYAQDREGNVWYLGEDTQEYEDGVVVSTEGSWLAGRDGAQPGVILPAEPESGLRYRQEYYAGHAEDRARVLRTDASVTVPYGSFRHAVKTRETTPLAPDVVEQKYYARGVGNVRTVDVRPERGGEVLVSFTRGSYPR